MIPHTRKYHVITVHFGDDQATRTLITRLLQGKEIPDQIIVVDHAAEPFSRAEYDFVQVIRPEKNAGYGAGINLGLGILVGSQVNPQDIVIALNNDAQLQPQSLAHIEAWWASHPSAKLAGIKLGHVNLVTGRSSLNFTFRIPNSIFYLSYLDGACLIAPLSTFLALQGLPTANFMYWEDVEFSARARQLGLNLQLIPNTGITHHSRPEAARVGDHLYYLVRNGAIFLSTRSPRPWRYLWKIRNSLRRLYHALRKKTPESTIVGQALRDAALHKTGPRT